VTQPDPENLEPDSEQELFEKLSMGEQEFRDLKNLRILISRILVDNSDNNDENIE